MLFRVLYAISGLFIVLGALFLLLGVLGVYEAVGVGASITMLVVGIVLGVIAWAFGDRRAL